MKTLDQMSLADLKAWRPRKVGLRTIREMARRIAAVCHPQRIVLFGSYARQEAKPRSDVDFLVILETPLPRPQRTLPLYSALRDFPVGVDIVVYTPDEIEAYAGLPRSFVQTALREGKTLYDQEQS